VDPAFALSLAHLCNTEYSTEGLKKQLLCNTPHMPPQMGMPMGPPGGMNIGMYGGGMQHHGRYDPRW
jgi:hypothetical protein